MSSNSIEQLKELLLSCLDEERNVTDMAGALDVITKLQTAPITREILEATRLGLVINDVRRKSQDSNPQLGKLCRGLIKDWQKLVSASSTPATGGGKSGISPGPERLTTPSSRTTTPRQTATAKLIAESGLRCSPSPASSTPKLQPTTPSMVNGTSSRPGTSSTGVSPETSRNSHRSTPAATSSYAPPEPQQQPTTNGPAQTGLRIRIKYGGVDQQPSIVREIESRSSPKLPEQSKAAEELASGSNHGAEEAANRRKRKIPPDQASETIGLVNGGSKSVSPNTPVPSPAPSISGMIKPASVPPPPSESTTKTSKKSKSTSPDTGPTPVTSVTNILQRPKLKSTAELVAEMTRSYPENVSINLDNVVAAPASPGRTASTSVIASVLANDSDPDYDDDANDADYRAPGERVKKTKVTWKVINESDKDINKNELLHRYLRDHSSGDGDGKRRKREKGLKGVERSSSLGDDSNVEHSENRVIVERPPIDWYASVQLPPLDLSVLDTVDGDEEDIVDEASGSGSRMTSELEKKPESDSIAADTGKLLDSCITVDDDSVAGSSKTDALNTDTAKWRSRLLKKSHGDRQILAMPYVDIGLPDFIEYAYSNRQQYLAHWSER